MQIKLFFSAANYKAQFGMDETIPCLDAMLNDSVLWFVNKKSQNLFINHIITLRRTSKTVILQEINSGKHELLIDVIKRKYSRHPPTFTMLLRKNEIKFVKKYYRTTLE